MALLNFDANTVDPNVGFDPIPAGKYNAVIVDSEMKATKTGDGKYLELTFEVLDGEFKGRKVWSRLNINNPNKKTQDIAQGELSAICRAVNVMVLQESSQLHNRPLEITVKCKERKDTSEITNEVRVYAPKDAASNPAAPAKQKSNPAPWGRK